MNPGYRSPTTHTSVARLALIAALALGSWSQRATAAEAPPVAPATPAAPAVPTASVDAQRAEMERQLATAQRQLEASARQVAQLSGQLGAEAGNRFMVRSMRGGPPRAMLGLQLAATEGQGGAKVLEVSPGGPAAEAGIKAGDTIISVGGNDITKDSNPGQALVERTQQLDPDVKVQVGVLRDGKKQTFAVTPRAMPEMAWGQSGMVTASAGGPGRPQGPRNFVFAQGTAVPLAPGMPAGRVQHVELVRDDGGMGSRFRGMEFATLSEGLGSYFGVKTGVLVVRAGHDPAFKLKDGDVILSIDGREPTSAQHAGRILRSYQAGEKVSIRVQRDRKAQNMEVTVPGGRGED